MKMWTHEDVEEPFAETLLGKTTLKLDLFAPF